MDFMTDVRCPVCGAKIGEITDNDGFKVKFNCKLVEATGKMISIVMVCGNRRNDKVCRNIIDITKDHEGWSLNGTKLNLGG
jgi:hypothetical protein